MTAAEHGILKTQILKYLNAQPDTRAWTCASGLFKTGGRFVSCGLGKGAADIIAVSRGRFVAVEVKTGSGVMTEEQKKWAKTVLMCGGIVILARSFSSFKDIFKEAFDESLMS